MLPGRRADGCSCVMRMTWPSGTSSHKLVQHFVPNLGHSEIAISPDGRTVVACDKDGNLRLWDADTGVKKPPKAVNPDGYLSHIQFSPDGKALVTSGTYHSYRVWDAATLAETAVFGRPSKGESFPAAFSFDSRFLAILDNIDGSLQVWDVQTRKEVSRMSRTVEGRWLFIAAIHFDPKGNFLLTTEDRVVRKWDPRTGRPLTDPSRPHHDPSVLAVSGDGNALAVAYGLTIRVWDVKTAKERFSLPITSWGSQAAAFSRDSRRLAYTHDDQTVRICDAVTGKELAALGGHKGAVTAVAYSADGGTIYTVGADAMLRVWDAATGQERQAHGLKTPYINFQFFPHENSATVRRDNFSPDGRTLTTRFAWTERKPSNERNYNIRVWHYNTATGERIFLKANDPVLFAFAWAPDGRTYAGVVERNGLSLFDPATGEPITRLREPRGNLSSTRLAWPIRRTGGFWRRPAVKWSRFGM